HAFCPDVLVALVFFTAPPPPGITTLSLHDALPISAQRPPYQRDRKPPWFKARFPAGERYGHIKDLMREHDLHTVCEEARCPNIGDRKSTRLNSSHVKISYAVFCLKKKNKEHSTKRQ